MFLWVYVFTYITAAFTANWMVLMTDAVSPSEYDAVAFALWVNSLDAEKVAGEESFYSKNHREMFPTSRIQNFPDQQLNIKPTERKKESWQK